MSATTLHQIVVGASPHDAITDQALLIRQWLREMGYVSDLYAYHVHEDLVGDVLPYATYRSRSAEPYVIFHHSIGSPVVEAVAALPQQVILIYHNVTPPEFFAQIDPFWAAQMRLGLDQLDLIRPRTALALADSPFNAADLQRYGYETTYVLPITFDPTRYDIKETTPEIMALPEQGPLLLFVGRIAPNKRQEDLIKLLAHYCRIEPRAQLALVGDKWLQKYVLWLEDLAQTLGVADQVIMPGRVSDRDLVSYYRAADLYISMSEHEGFGKPYIESMYLGLPIMAYAAASTPGTLGDTGVLFYQKSFVALAELTDLLMTDAALRSRLADKQRRRVDTFLADRVKALLREYLDQVGI